MLNWNLMNLILKFISKAFYPLLQSQCNQDFSTYPTFYMNFSMDVVLLLFNQYKPLPTITAA